MGRERSGGESSRRGRGSPAAPDSSGRAALSHPVPRPHYETVIGQEQQTGGNESEKLAPYAGWWNGIFPIKDGAGGTGETVGLILRTTGYWMGFHVDPSQLWP